MTTPRNDAVASATTISVLVMLTLFLGAAFGVLVSSVSSRHEASMMVDAVLSSPVYQEQTSAAAKFRSSSSSVQLPSQCGKVNIWSHRGGLGQDDQSTRTASTKPTRATCWQFVRQLHAHNLSHFEVDILWYRNQIVVAHPVEMEEILLSNNQQLILSPCAQQPLKAFLDILLAVYHAQSPWRESLFVIFEPKATWEENGAEVDNPFLAPPFDVITQALTILEQHPLTQSASMSSNKNVLLSSWSKSRTSTAQQHQLDHHHCGIILEESQSRQLSTALLKRIAQTCDVVQSYRPTNHPTHLPPVTLFQGTLPSLQLFEKDDWFLQDAHNNGFFNVVWFVDTPMQLARALQLQGVTGILSNQPVDIKQIYEEVCHQMYRPLVMEG